MITYYKNINPMQHMVVSLMNTNTMVMVVKQGVVKRDVPTKDCLDFLDRTIPAGTSYLIFTQTTDTLQTEAGNCMEDIGGIAGYGNSESGGMLHPVITEHIIITNIG